MSWYVHPSRQLRDDELPPELVVTNRDGSIEQVYVPYDATGEQLKAENAKLREELAKWERLAAGIELPEYPVTQFKPKDLERENAKLQERIHKLEMEGSDYFYRTAYAEDANRTLEVGNAKLQAENAKLRELVRDMYKSMDVSCQFGHAIPAGTMAHVKNRAIGLGVEVGA